MKLDVVVPTYNRSNLLRRTIASLIQAPIPAGLDVTILIVDNNSKDDTRLVVKEIQSTTSRTIVYVKEANQGLSHARNGGISAGSSEIIGFIDDDEEIHKDWFTVIAREFADPATQYIGGPCLPNWESPAPKWLPPGYYSAIGLVLPKPRAAFGGTFPGILMGGNAVFRRSIFEIAGRYDTRLGRSGKGLLSDEDAELYRRLCAANLSGMYVPELVIYHYIPSDRLTKRYFRRWCYWRGASQGISDRTLKEPVRYVLGVPLYRIGRAVRGVASLPQLFLKKEYGLAFSAELASWDLIGFIYGRHFMQIDQFYGKQQS
jgi:glycosyltransferase involved in cell wall biosynthesis